MKSSRFAFRATLFLVMSACGSAGDTTSFEALATTVDLRDVPADDPAASDLLDSVPSTTQASPSGDGDLPFGLQRGDVEFSTISADPSFYRDEPVYVGNEQPTDAVRAWAEQQPGFEDIWIDRDNNGWLAVGFTSEVDQRQAELEAEFPGVGATSARRCSFTGRSQ